MSRIGLRAPGAAQPTQAVRRHDPPKPRAFSCRLAGEPATCPSSDEPSCGAHPRRATVLICEVANGL